MIHLKKNIPVDVLLCPTACDQWLKSEVPIFSSDNLVMKRICPCK